MMLEFAPIEFTVTIQDLRPGHEGKIYRRQFVARTRFDAIEDAAATLLMTDSLEEGSDFHIVDAR
jgi:hypothetical protein